MLIEKPGSFKNSIHPLQMSNLHQALRTKMLNVSNIMLFTQRHIAPPSILFLGREPNEIILHLDQNTLKFNANNVPLNIYGMLKRPALAVSNRGPFHHREILVNVSSFKYLFDNSSGYFMLADFEQMSNVELRGAFMIPHINHILKVRENDLVCGKIDLDSQGKLSSATAQLFSPHPSDKSRNKHLFHGLADGVSRLCYPNITIHDDVPQYTAQVKLGINKNTISGDILEMHSDILGDD